MSRFLRINLSLLSAAILYEAVITHGSLAWVGFEYVSSKGLISFPMSISITQYNNAPLLQMVSVTGPYGLSFLIILTNVIIFEWIVVFKKKNEFKALACVSVLCILIFSVFWLLGGAREISKCSGASTDSAEVAVIQGSVPRWMYILEKKEISYTKKMQEVYFGLTEMANKERSPEIIVWPEGAVNQQVLEIPVLKKRIIDMVESNNNTMIIGAPHLDEEKNYYNAAFVITEPRGTIEKYEKIKLLPWVETYSPGKRRGIFDIDLGKIGVLICFESMFPDMSRALVNKGADVIFVLTNDAGFNKTHLPDLHAREAILRAVENRCPVVRAAQSGISMVIDRFGRVRKKTELFSSTIMYCDVDFSKRERSVYSRMGDIFVYLCFFLMFSGIVVRLKRR